MTTEEADGPKALPGQSPDAVAGGRRSLEVAGMKRVAVYLLCGWILWAQAKGPEVSGEWKTIASWFADSAYESKVKCEQMKEGLERGKGADYRYACWPAGYKP